MKPIKFTSHEVIWLFNPLHVAHAGISYVPGKKKGSYIPVVHENLINR